MKGPLTQLYPFLVFWIFLNVFTLNIISSPFPRNDILYCDWSLFTLLIIRCRMLYLPFLMCMFMGMWCVCMSEHACCSLKLISNVFLDHSLPHLLRQGLPQKLKPTSSDNFRKPACSGDAPPLSASAELDHSRLLFLPGIALNSGNPNSGVLTLALSHLSGPKLYLFKDFYFLSID